MISSKIITPPEIRPDSAIHMPVDKGKDKAGKPRPRSMSLSVDWDKVFGYDLQKLKQIHSGFNIVEKELYTYLTKSTYKGGWNLIGMANFGTYTLPNKVEYEGQLMDGMFDNEGMLVYPNAHKIEGFWEKDKLISSKFMFPDGLMYEEPWEYCIMPDRRFWQCIQMDMRPAGREYLTPEQPPRTIPEGCYDTGDGFYNPKTKSVQSATDPQRVLRIPSRAEEQWIKENCRKAWDEPTGYRPDLYETWNTGRHCEKYKYSDSDEFIANDCEENINDEQRESSDDSFKPYFPGIKN